MRLLAVEESWEGGIEATGMATIALATIMVEMPESNRFAAGELGLGDGAGLEGRAKLVAGARDLDSDAGGGRPGAGSERRWRIDQSSRRQAKWGQHR